MKLFLYSSGVVICKDVPTCKSSVYTEVVAAVCRMTKSEDFNCEHICSLVHSVVYLCIFICSFLISFIHLFIHSLTHFNMKALEG